MLLNESGDLQERPIAFLANPGFDYTAIMWGIWRAGGIAVPLSIFAPLPELEYVLEDTSPAAVVSQPDFANLIKPLAERSGIRFALSSDALNCASGPLPVAAPGRRAMIIYTSGTTGKPKGVVTTHANIAAQISCLVHAWEWTQDDRILNVLPLHHVTFNNGGPYGTNSLRRRA